MCQPRGSTRHIAACGCQAWDGEEFPLSLCLLIGTKGAQEKKVMHCRRGLRCNRVLLPAGRPLSSSGMAKKPIAFRLVSKAFNGLKHTSERRFL